MLIKCQLRIECQAEMFMFMFGQLSDNDVIKKYRRMGWFHLTCLLIHIRVKLHFPLEDRLA